MYVYTFCKSLCIINVWSPYGLPCGPSIYFIFIFDQMWLVWSSLLAAVRKPADRPVVLLPPFKGIWPGFGSGAITGA